MKHCVLLGVSAGLWLMSPARAEAQEVSSGDGEVEDALATFARDDEAFEAALGLEPDCKVACDAFESMERSAEKLCALDAGNRCTAARERVKNAAQRLREACPDCAAVREDVLRAADDRDFSDGEGPAESPSSPAAAPAPESKRGTCAACTIGSDDDDSDTDGAVLSLLALMAAFGLRRRRRTAQPERPRCQ